MKKTLKNYIILAIIIITGLFIRLSNLDKPEGLWNDEYIAWWISSYEFGKPLFEKIFSNCHMPIYYLFLKFWCVLFGNNDITLRVSSVFIGIISIITTYFLGKTYKDTKTGIICALFASFSSFLIYFSQEVRLYGLIYLLSTLIAIYFIKSIRKNSSKNISLYILFNLLLLLTHTIAFVYVFFNLVIFSLIVLKNNPKLRKKILLAYSTLFLLFVPAIPFIITILTRQNLSQNWGIFNLSKIFFLFNDFITPKQLNITNSPLNFINYFNINIMENTIFILVPFLIATYLIFKAIKKKETILIGLFSTSFLYALVLIITAFLGKLVLSTKYSVEIYPTIILLFAYGLTSLSAKAQKLLGVIYFGITIIFLLFNPHAPQKLHRPEGHKTPATLITYSNLQNEDYLILLYHQLFRYEKYLTLKTQNVIELNKATTPTYLMGEGYQEKELKLYGKEKLRKAFMFEDTEELDKRFNHLFKEIPQKKKIAILIPLQVSFFSSNDLKRIASNDKEYKSTEIMFLAFSLAKIKLLNTAFEQCEYINMTEKDNWVVINFRKK